MSHTESTDVVVIGSGFGGSVAAARISPHARVVVLERGKRWQAPEFRQTLELGYWNEIYDFYPGRNILAIQGKGVGGGSLVYSNVSLRAPSKIFDLQQAGRRLWPQAYSRGALDPYYARVEQMLNVVQLKWQPGPDEAWKGVPRADRVLAEGLGKLGRSCEPARLAVTGCTDCGWCSAGCRFGKKNNLTLNYIPQAEASGADIRPEHEVTSISRQKDGRYRVNFRRHDAGGDKGALVAKKVVISGGTFRSPYLLQRSKLRLRHLSRQVGRNLSVNGDIVFNAIIPGMQVERHKGKVIGSVSFDYLDQGFVFQGLYSPPTLSTLTMRDPATGRPFGAGMKAWARNYGHSFLGFAAFGLDAMDGRVYMGPDGPLLSYQASASTRAYYKRVIAAAREIVDALGGTLAPTIPEWMNMIETVHPIGACRMAEEGAEQGVVDPDGQVWNYPGLYVMDGSILPTPSMVNPSLTIAAVAERCSEKLLGTL